MRSFLMFATFVLCACKAPMTTRPESSSPKALLECIDVGQGNACLWRTGSHAVLFDAGPDSMGILDSLKVRGIDSLDWLLLSHGHRDHVGGAWELLGHIKIGCIHVGLDTTHPWGTDSVRTLAKRYGIRIDTLVRGDTLPDLSPWHVRVIWPPRLRETGDNGASLVVHVRDDVQSFLYTGDIGFAQESEILQLEPDLHTSILQVPHHGSATSSSLAFVGQLNPSLAFILVGIHNEYGHPTLEALQRLTAVLGDSSRIWRTDQRGTLHVVFTYDFGIGE